MLGMVIHPAFKFHMIFLSKGCYNAQYFINNLMMNATNNTSGNSYQCIVGAGFLGAGVALTLCAAKPLITQPENSPISHLGLRKVLIFCGGGMVLIGAWLLSQNCTTIPTELSHRNMSTID